MNIDIGSIRNAYNSGEMKPAEIAGQMEAMISISPHFALAQDGYTAEGGLAPRSRPSLEVRG